MDYIVTFSGVMAVVASCGLAIITFFIKKWIADVETQITKIETQITKIEADLENKKEKIETAIKDQIKEIEDGLDEKIEKTESSFRQSNNRAHARTDENGKKIETEIAAVKQFINDLRNDIATAYVQKDDFFRTLNSIEDDIKSLTKKIDILMQK